MCACLAQDTSEANLQANYHILQQVLYPCLGPFPEPCSLCALTGAPSSTSIQL